MATRPGAREANDAIRAALVQAASTEAAKEPFRLFGRGHEPRVTLDRSLAATLRGLAIPCVVLEGFGASRHYPLRVFVTAQKLLTKRLAYSPYSISDGTVHRRENHDA